MSNYAKIEKCSINNGKGVRTSIFFSGCNHHCKGCFNQELWGFDVSKPFTREVYETKIKPTINEHIAGISILGGEPLDPRNIQATRDLCEWFKRDFPDKDIWVWTGYKFEELLNWQLYPTAYQRNALSEIIIGELIDVLVDGKFIEEQKDLTLPWCGSRNQRVIDFKKTIHGKGVVLYE